MNNDIKEILDYMKIKQYISETNINFGYKTLSAGQVELLLDYITNLQEENDTLKLELSGYREAILRDDKLLSLQQRIDKAIEYISENDLLYLASKCSIVYSHNIEVVAIYDRLLDLLNILQGKDKGEDK